MLVISQSVCFSYLVFPYPLVFSLFLLIPLCQSLNTAIGPKMSPFPSLALSLSPSLIPPAWSSLDLRAHRYSALSSAPHFPALQCSCVLLVSVFFVSSRLFSYQEILWLFCVLLCFHSLFLNDNFDSFIPSLL